MREKQVSTTIGNIKGLDESTRNYIALSIWLVVFVGLLFLNTPGQSKLMTVGLIFQLTGAYSTFLLRRKLRYGLLVHGVPYAFALIGTMLLCLAPDFRHSVEASLLFLAVTAMMHGSIIYDLRKVSRHVGKTVFVSECVT